MVYVPHQQGCCVDSISVIGLLPCDAAGKAVEPDNPAVLAVAGLLGHNLGNGVAMSLAASAFTNGA